MKFWGAVVVGLLMYGSALCLTMSIFTQNNTGMIVYGVSTIVTGAIFKAIFDSV